MHLAMHANAQAHNGEPQRDNARGGLEWLIIAFYVLVAVGPIPMYFYLRASATLPEAEWAGSTPFDQYFGTGLLYHGSGAVAAYLLLKRRAKVLWPAWFLVAWAALTLVASAWRWLRGTADSGLLLIPTALVVILFALIARHLQRLHRRGSLNGATP
jgi:hypothetical protein